MCGQKSSFCGRSAEVFDWLVPESISTVAHRMGPCDQVPKIRIETKLTEKSKKIEMSKVFIVNFVNQGLSNSHQYLDAHYFGHNIFWLITRHGTK